MKVKDLFEAPFDSEQEEKFLAGAAKNHVDNVWGVNRNNYDSIIKKIAPDAESIGKGSYATAYGKSGHPEIVKITRSRNAIRWYEWCMKNQNNPWLPKVYKIQEIRSGVYYIRMERLTPVTKFIWKKEHIPTIVAIYSSGGLIYPQVFDKLGLTNKESNKLSEEKFRKYLMDKYYDDTDPGVIAIEKINSLALDHHGTLDVAISLTDAGNIMMRGSQPVLMDPID